MGWNVPTDKVPQVTREDFTRDTPCPCCGEKSLDRIEVDIGVGTECSPWSCFNCGADPFTARLMRERMEAENKLLREALDEAYAELSADSTRDGPRCLLLTKMEQALGDPNENKCLFAGVDQ